MEEGRRSGDTSSDYVVKNRSSSGCLVIRKKGVSDDAGSSRRDSDKKEKKKKKRARVDSSVLGSSDDELLTPPSRKLVSGTLRACNGLSGLDNEDGEDVVRRDGEDRKRNKLDVFEFDEYDSGFDFGSSMLGRSGSGKKKKSYFVKSGGRDGSRHPSSFLREKYDSGEPIRVQGKNGVLKVLVNAKKIASGTPKSYDRHAEVDGSRKFIRTEDKVIKNAPNHPTHHSDSKRVGKASSSAGHERKLNDLRSLVPKKNKRELEEDLEDSDTLLKLGPRDHKVHKSAKNPLQTKKIMENDSDSDDNDTALMLGPRHSRNRKTMKGASSGGKKLMESQLQPNKTKDGKVRRGSGTEKQKLREQIRAMLLNSGWTIDYRPRRNRDYQDAVYINPSGTAYWSIIKAYEALQKQLNNDEDEVKGLGDGSPFTPLADEVLSQLTRKTKKKMEKEMRMRQRDGNVSDNPRGITVRKSASIRDDEDSSDSGSHEEKLSSFLKNGGKALKAKTNLNNSVSKSSKVQSSTQHLHETMEKKPITSNSHRGRESRKLGRLTLLARKPPEGLNMESDGFVPYAGKRTVLSWLIDSKTVQLNQKVRYMNRRRSKVMLEGWVTRDGIHCGCCSKILTISKFEIHAGSKVRQSFQNIYLDSGVSLLECQVDAWKEQELAECSGYKAVDTSGGDPNDDTCGICGDGGDLICCDSCPSTFHQSCLGIKMLPSGDWHCPNCTCKLCGLASADVDDRDDGTVSGVSTCRLCAKRYHTSCVQETDLSDDECFCGKECRELFQQLQNHLGVKHDLEAGFSWSLIHRMDIPPDTSPQDLSQRAECNSKLAVALSVMDECFLPIFDRRSEFNLIHSVLYNCGSNFNRLNYSGFYTFILERGDEMISAASIRFHGTRLAEMPFIGTRHMYRRQGMCRRLLGAIELALSSMKVEKLIIPAISELMHTWTEVFGFATLNESLKQDIKFLNMLVFPGIDMLQKQLGQQENVNGNKAITSDAKLVEPKDSECITPLVANKSDSESLSGNNSHEDDHTGLEPANETNDEAVVAESGSICTPKDSRSQMLLIEKKSTDSECRKELDDTYLDGEVPSKSDTNHSATRTYNKVGSDSPVINVPDNNEGDKAAESHYPGVSSDLACATGGTSNNSEQRENTVSLNMTTSNHSQLEEKITESACGPNGPVGSDVKDKSKECKEDRGSPDVSFRKKADIDDAKEKHHKESVTGGDLVPMSQKEKECADFKSRDDCPPEASIGKHLSDSQRSHSMEEIETESSFDHSIQHNTQSCKDTDLDETSQVDIDMSQPEAPDSTKETNRIPSTKIAEPSGISAEDNTQSHK